MIKRSVFGLAILACMLLQGCISLPASLFGGNRGEVRSEEIEKPDHFWTVHQILMIPLSGTVDEGSMRSSEGMLVSLKDRLKAAEDNERIKAVILRIDSPGGSVTAADLIYHEILQFKEKMSKKGRSVPVVALMMDTAASGGLYIAMAADEVYALPTTITGSIGVIMMLPGLQGLSNKIGFEMRVIKSGANKDIGSPWKDISPEQHQIIQNMINRDYEQFLKTITDSRGAKGLTREKLMPIADGRVLSSSEAKEAGLIDEVLYPNEAIERVKAKAGIKDAGIISYEYPSTYRGNIYAKQHISEPQAQGSGDVNLLKFDLGALTGMSKKPQFMYLWMP